MLLKRICCLSFVLVLAACSGDADEKTTTYSKEGGAALNGTLPNGSDLCDLANWYGDGECDDFCPLPDEDCGLGGCASDADCSAGEVCQNGACTTSSPGCTSDAECAADEICGPDGTCIVREMVPPQCQVDADCAATEVCIDGYCTPDDVTLGCTSDDDCLDVEFCGANGECLPREMAPPQCQVDADCAATEVCTDGECVASQPDICQSDADCALGEVCDDTSRCVPHVCGGFAGLACGADEFCDYDESVGTACGAADGTGTCTPRPDTCATVFDPVCGCDGMTYSNACQAFAAGTDVWAEGECQN